MPIGVGELLLILVIVFVIFGAGKLPQVMNDLGKGVKGLKDGLKEDGKKPSPAKSKKPTAKKPATKKKVSKKPTAKKSTKSANKKAKK